MYFRFAWQALGVKDAFDSFTFHCRGSPWVGRSISALGPDKNSKDIDFLDKYAMERWEVSYEILDSFFFFFFHNNPITMIMIG